eukprot:scaffold676780_cov53-Prasinocladus_malaysianus.AAC.1
MHAGLHFHRLGPVAQALRDGPPINTAFTRRVVSAPGISGWGGDCRNEPAAYGAVKEAAWVTSLHAVAIWVVWQQRGNVFWWSAAGDQEDLQAGGGLARGN